MRQSHAPRRGGRQPSLSPLRQLLLLFLISPSWESAPFSLPDFFDSILVSSVSRISDYLMSILQGCQSLSTTSVHPTNSVFSPAIQEPLDVSLLPARSPPSPTSLSHTTAALGRFQDANPTRALSVYRTRPVSRLSSFPLVLNKQVFTVYLQMHLPSLPQP